LAQSGKASDLHSGSARFGSRLDTERRDCGLSYLEIGHDHFFPCPVYFTEREYPLLSPTQSNRCILRQLSNVRSLFVMIIIVVVCKLLYSSVAGRAVFARLNTRVVSSNTTRDMDVCMRVFCVYAVLCVGSGVATG
jgi:hypothetical protein